MVGSSDTVEVRCLGCGRMYRMPQALAKVAEYYEGEPVLFCSRSCNAKFISDMGRKGQEQQMSELIERLEK